MKTKKESDSLILRYFWKMSLEESVFMARVAEQAERFDDMVDYLNAVVKAKSSDFTTEERNLLSVGFKNLIGSKRTAIRTISAIE